MTTIELIMSLNELLEAIENSEKLVRVTLIAKEGGDLTSVLNDIEYSCCMARQDIESLRSHLKTINEDTQ